MDNTVRERNLLFRETKGEKKLHYELMLAYVSEGDLHTDSPCPECLIDRYGRLEDVRHAVRFHCHRYTRFPGVLCHGTYG